MFAKTLPVRSTDVVPRTHVFTLLFLLLPFINSPLPAFGVETLDEMSLSLICDYGSSDEEPDSAEAMDIGQECALREEDATENIDEIVLELVNSMVTKVDKHSAKQYHFSTSHYRSQSLGDSDSSSDDDSSSDSDIPWTLGDSDNYDEDDDDLDLNHSRGQRKPNRCVTKGELTIDDLPPIEKLQISVDVNCLTQVGIVSSTLDKLVVIQSFKNVPVLDLDTVLFSREGCSIGESVLNDNVAWLTLNVVSQAKFSTSLVR